MERLSLENNIHVHSVKNKHIYKSAQKSSCEIRRGLVKLKVVANNDVNTNNFNMHLFSQHPVLC